MIPSDSVQSAGNRQPEDVELVRRMRSGDKLAYSDFYDRFSRPLYSVALRILNDRPEAEEVVHDIFLHLWENADSFDEADGTILSSIIALTRNRAIERLRTPTQRVTVPSDAASHSDLLAANTATELISADDSFFKEETFAVRKALTTLPAEQLQVLELAYFGGLNQQQIASQLGEPADSVTSRIRRGLLKLRDLLNQRHD